MQVQEAQNLNYPHVYKNQELSLDRKDPFSREKSQW